MFCKKTWQFHFFHLSLQIETKWNILKKNNATHSIFSQTTVLQKQKTFQTKKRKIMTKTIKKIGIATIVAALVAITLTFVPPSSTYACPQGQSCVCNPNDLDPGDGSSGTRVPCAHQFTHHAIYAWYRECRIPGPVAEPCAYRMYYPVLNSAGWCLE